MKRTMAYLTLAIMLVFAASSFDAFAQNKNMKNVQNGKNTAKTVNMGKNYIDANKDGKCDNMGATTCTGTCTNKDKCANYVDANNNGKCDLKENGTCTGKKDGTGKGKGKGKGKGNCGGCTNQPQP